MRRELTRRESNALLTVRLVMRYVAARDGTPPPDLDDRPSRVTTLADGVLFGYPDVLYGLVDGGADGRNDHVYETRMVDGLFRSRLYTRAGALVIAETFDPTISPAGVAAVLAGRTPAGEPEWN